MPETIIRGLVVTKIWGIAESRRSFRRIIRLEEKGCEVGVRIAIEYLLAETKKVTPKDTGYLRDSGSTFFAGRGFNTRGYIYFSAPYATYVHEDLTKWHAPGTYAKFLERTVRDPKKKAIAAAKIAASIHAYVRFIG